MEAGVVLSLTQSGKLIYLHLSPTTQENILCQHNSILFHSTSSKGKKKKVVSQQQSGRTKGGNIQRGGESAHNDKGKHLMQTKLYFISFK